MENKLTFEFNYEAHFASLCVAIVSGSLGGLLAIWLDSKDQNLAHLIVAGILAFSISWLVCKFLFPSAHKWYGAKSLYHRVYDLVAIGSGVLVCYFLI